MINGIRTKIYDLEERTQRFARNISILVTGLPRTLPNQEYARQLIRSSASIGANYIEANDALGKKDFLMRLKICRKEAKETRYWLSLINCHEEQQSILRASLQEVVELTKIFRAIITKAS